MSPLSRPGPEFIADLKRRIGALEAHPKPLSGAAEASAAGKTWGFGLAQADQYLPARGFAGGLHDFVPAAYGDTPAVSALVLALLAGRSEGKPVLWAQTREAAREFGRPYGPGLKRTGLTPADMFSLTARCDSDVLWALEEGLRAHALGAVIGEVEDADFLSSRRLALAAAATDTVCFLIRTGRRGTTSAGTSAWRIAPLCGAPDPWDTRAPGPFAWRAELMRVRGGRPARFLLEWTHETHGFRLAAPLANRADAPRTAAKRTRNGPAFRNSAHG